MIWGCSWRHYRPWQPVQAMRLEKPSWQDANGIYMSHTRRFVPNAFLFMMVFCQAEFLRGEQQWQCIINVLLVNTLLMHWTQKNAVLGAVFITALQVAWSNCVSYVKLLLPPVVQWASTTWLRWNCLQHTSKQQQRKKPLDWFYQFAFGMAFMLFLGLGSHESMWVQECWSGLLLAIAFCAAVDPYLTG